MKLSTKGRYGLRAMVDIAEYSGNDAVSIQQISERQNLSERYLEQLIKQCPGCRRRICSCKGSIRNKCR